MPREQINKLCNSYTMEHHTVKKMNVPHREISNSENKKSQSTQTSLYKHQKHAKQKIQCLGTHVLVVECKDKLRA